MCRCAILCNHYIDHLWHVKFKDVTQYSEWLAATQKIHFWVPVIVNLFTYYLIQFPGTGLNPAQGPRGNRPELMIRLSSRDASSKRPRFLGFSPQRGFKRPWPLFQRTQVISLGLGSPLNYIAQHHNCIICMIRYIAMYMLTRFAVCALLYISFTVCYLFHVLCYTWRNKAAHLTIGKLFSYISNFVVWEPFQNKDVILPQQEIPFWR